MTIPNLKSKLVKYNTIFLLFQLTISLCSATNLLPVGDAILPSIPERVAEQTSECHVLRRRTCLASMHEGAGRVRAHDGEVAPWPVAMAA